MVRLGCELGMHLQCNNVIAIMLQDVRSVLLWMLCVKMDMQCQQFGSLVLTPCVSCDCVLGLL